MRNGSNKPLSLKDFMQFNRELSVLVKTRLPLSPGLRRLGSDKGVSHSLKQLTDSLARELEQGRGLAEALDKNAEAFPRVYMQMVRIGEESGSLFSVLQNIVRIGQQQMELRSSLLTILIYPLWIVGLALAIITGITVMVIPPMKDIYYQLGAELPALTRFIFQCHEGLMTRGWILLLVVLVVVTYVLFRITLSSRLRAMLDPILLRIPVIGPLISTHLLALWCRLLSQLLVGGVSLDEALDYMEEATPSQTIRSLSRNARELIRRGHRLATALEGCPVFPVSFRWMIARAEERGDLVPVLSDLADLSDLRIVSLRQRALVLFEPFLLMAIGIAIGVFVLAFFLPLFWFPRLI
jgi:type IV pilus assembly protein PilC